MEADNFFMITFKYGGHWVTIKKQDRKKYDGWKQKTVKISKEVVSISLLFEEIEKFCPWICGLEIELAYHVFGTSPKEYKVLAIEDDVREMVAAANGINHLEVIIASSNANEDIMGSYDKDVRDNQQIVECANVCNESFEVDQNEVRETLQVGAHFIDSATLRNALRSYTIVNNFGVKIKASGRKRVIATCSYRGCPWRVRASVCADGQNFEVRKIAGTHICPDVNRAGNKQATSCWIANQIQDLVKKQPDVPPKMIKNNLESTYALSLPYMKLWRSRELARGIVFGSADDNYSWVPTLKAELAKRNPGSHITYTYDSVDIESSECTCRVWQITGLPCIHAAAFIGMREYPLWHAYVDEYYHCLRYRMAYPGPIATIPSKEQWIVVNDGVQICAPNSSRPRGRPKKNRIKSFSEQNKQTHRCSRCGLWGHKKNTCKNPLTKNLSVSGQPSRHKLQGGKQLVVLRWKMSFKILY